MFSMGWVNYILAHQIGVSTVFTHMIKFYLRYAVPTRGKDENGTAAH